MNSKLNKPKRRFLLVSGSSYSLVNFRGPLVQSLISAGLEVHAASPGLHDDPRTCRQLEAWGVFVHDIPMQRTGLNPWYDFLTLKALYLLMRNIRPDVVLAYTIKPVVYGMLAAWLAKVPQRYALITGLGYAFAGEARGKRALVFHLVRRLYSAALNKVDKVFFQNPDDESLFRDLGILRDRVPSQVLNGSGVDMAHFAAAPLPDGPPRFLLVARLLADKGVRQYAEAARRIKQQRPEVVFQLAGDIDSNPDTISQQELDTWVGEGSLEHLGWLNDVRPALAESSVFVLPSYYREGTPRSILEAMSMGRAVITTDAPGCRETVTNGDNGYLIPVKNVDALVKAMQHFIDRPALVKTMGQRSHEIAKDKYDVHKVNAVMLEAMGIGKPELRNRVQKPFDTITAK
ncbi:MULTISPECIES: glycosyltransferase family 4 protein [Halomonadaceae]|jgi:glycosyltransferase involved in cell wall biosynthesis|uniref:glycosyltransferase family 4 protein n=1 Tax=Halomonadaceae TaxID=28256 RepID=UPI00110D4F47|nr:MULTISPECIES: glycosyltransferase family 4 protein [Halomonas]UEQ06173.1 glycosyltransferase family 4 protein [Halomonas profundus]TMU24080.1 glycosyltransferase family 4 protein [Halomonas sp. ATBC28]CAD5260394.1 Glycosyltransferase family 1 protein [Halomonas sp. 156]CAD5288592.1 Glycosyltransferase family 1 protein [Halomonas sp. 113]CAD5290012.1 Glycosyltransferase family 1 protein [Halomonas sp. 59]